MTANTFRKIALGFAGAIEASHLNHPDFRLSGKVFATLGYPNKEWGMVKLTPDQQAKVVTKNPKAFVPVKGAWGVKICSHRTIRRHRRRLYVRCVALPSQIFLEEYPA